MPVFQYTAVSNEGKDLKGTIDADNIRSARSRLRSQGLFVSSISEMAATQRESKDILQKFRGVSLGAKAVATRQLATLISAGFPLVTALQSLSDQTENETLRRVLVEVREKVEEGMSLSKALALYPKIFPRLYTNMVQSGEASGTLEAVLSNLANYLEKQLQLRREVSAALFYPALMFVFCFLVVLALVTYVVPQITQIFEKEGAALPTPTVILIGLSDFIIGYWPLLIIFAIAIFYLLVRYYNTPNGRENFDRKILKVPLFGELYRRVLTARVSLTLSALLGSGVNLLQGLEISRNIVGNVHFQRALDEASIGVREGRSLGREIAKSGIFPSLLSSMITLGEQSGQLEQMLERAAKNYESEVKAQIDGITSLIEPIMIIVLGGIVFSIVIAILLPIMDMINIVQR